ncbi:urease accessory protein UreD [Actinobacillus seminis]|uniref:urease accessory protein UreD n=1 Tax=Actinobacillus seminis TaxID=722 RepID=UPI003B92B52F
MKTQLILSTKCNAQGKTQLDRYFVSPPFKLVTLPPKEDWVHELHAMQMSSSPGLLGEDEIEVDISLAKNTALSLTTQAFTRVQTMNIMDVAKQQTKITLAENSALFYLPHPLVLHKDSALQQTAEIEMTAQSRLIYGEIVAIGRVLNGERFAFRCFSSYLRITHQQRPLLSDRIYWQPETMALTAVSQMKDFSHQGSLVYVDLRLDHGQIKTLVSELQQDYATDDALEIGISQLNTGGLFIRVLAYRAEAIEHFFSQIGKRLKAV